jgi:hypothetical protein
MTKRERRAERAAKEALAAILSTHPEATATNPKQANGADVAWENATKAVPTQRLPEAGPETERKIRTEATAAKTSTKTAKNKETRPCVCGCGQRTHGLFFPSHDGRVHGWFVRVRKNEKDLTTLPMTVRAAFARWDGTASVKQAFAA